MKVKLKKRNIVFNFSHSRTYKVQGETRNAYLLYNDNGYLQSVSKRKFERVGLFGMLFK